MSNNLFNPLQVGDVTVSNRVALAPLTRLRSDKQIPPPEAIQYYGERAGGYPGTLLISEATAIAPQAVGHYAAPGIWSKEQIASWKKVTDEVHKNKSFIYLQLWAHGRSAIEPELKRVDPSYEVVSASDVAVAGSSMPGLVKPRALTIPEIKEYVKWYVQAAKNAIEAGFDGVEIHSANGYLLNQFLHEDVNHRTDEYGGSIENRARFTLEVVDAVAEAIGASKVGIRFNFYGGFMDMDYKTSSPLPQYTYVVNELERRAKEGKRISYIHIMEPRVDSFDPSGSHGAVDRSANAWVRQIWKGVIVRTGSLGTDYKLMHDIADADDKLILGVGRLFISNPDFVKKLEDGVPQDMFERKTFYWDYSDKFTLPQGYTESYKRGDLTIHGEVKIW